MKLHRATTMLALVAIGGFAAVSAHAQGIKVNGKQIPESRIEVAIKSRVAQGHSDTPQLRNSVREALINQEVITQEATKKGLQNNPEVAAQIEINRENILVSAFVRDYLRTHPVSEETLKQEYDHIKARLGTKEYKAHHILVEKENEAKDIIARLENGEDFEKLAKELSKDSGTREKGGDLGWNLPSSYVQSFGEALAKLKKGEVTGKPVQSKFGWHVIRLDEERAYKAPAFEQVKANLQRSVQQNMVKKLVADLRAKAKIE